MQKPKQLTAQFFRQKQIYKNKLLITQHEKLMQMQHNLSRLSYKR